MGVAADANGGGHHGRRTPWGEGNFSTAGPTAKNAATARGLLRRPKAPLGYPPPQGTAD